MLFPPPRQKKNIKKKNSSLALSSHQKKGGFADSVSPDNVTKGHDVILNTHYQLPNCLITNSHVLKVLVSFQFTVHFRTHDITHACLHYIYTHVLRF